ncbi:MAG: hypothetical protein J6A01_04615, partial [Proteobacteria bacterium]|nr:hypothetical protein [Pseudomonadota bacterium]
ASAPVDESGKTEAQLKNEKLEEAQRRFNAGEVGKYVYVPPEKDESAVDAEGKAKDGDDEDKDDKSWHVFANASFDLGLGAFTKHEYARKIRSRFAFAFGASYEIPVIDVTIVAQTGFSQWMSKAGGTNGQYEFRWADTTIGLARDIWSYDEKEDKFHVGFTAGLDFTLPTSKASISENLYTTIAPTLGFDIGLAGLSFGYAITYAHSFHEYTSSTYDPSEVDILSRSTGNELLGVHDVAAGGVLDEIQLLNMFALKYQFIKELSLVVGFGFSDIWTYDNGTISKDDEFVGMYSKVGRGHKQYSQGTLSLNYSPIKYLTLTLGMSSTQPWKTADNKSIRFPWFDTISPSKNYTKFLFNIAFVY